MYVDNFWGMNYIWWFLWVIMIFWIFAIPYDIPGQRRRKNTPLDILYTRYTLGEINKDEYQERKRILTEG